MAEALYRKYRPQIFEDVVGQEHIERTIKNAIDQDKVSHAYLFTGPRGTGKTTTARLLAKALLCEKGPTAEPDGTCADCESIAAGNHPDVYELDAASRTGVENVREEIIGRVQFAPTQGRYKVYIIDEVHMLSTAAFNALLKTLEEPPSHVVFILCTTDPRKVPETIHSRCQRFDFHRISIEAIVSRLGAICVAEDVEFEGEALDLIAHRAEGGMRNALTSLEQLIAFGEGKVTMKTAERLLGSLDSSDMAEIVVAIGQRDVARCFTWTAEYIETGSDLAQFVRDFAEHIRNMYILSLANSDTVLEISESTRRELIQEMKYFGPDRLARMLGVLGDLSAELRTSTNPRLSFEIALTRMVRPDSDMTMEALAERIEALESGYSAVAHVSPRPLESPEAGAPAPTTPAASAASAASVAPAAASVAATPPVSASPAENPSASAPVPVSAPAKPASPSASTPVAAPVSAPCIGGESSIAGLNNPAALQRVWQAALQQIKKDKAAYGVLFMNTKTSFDNQRQELVIEFAAENDFAYNAVQKPEALSVVTQALERAAGAPLVFRYAKANASSSSASASVPAPVSPPASEPTPVGAMSHVSASVQPVTSAPLSPSGSASVPPAAAVSAPQATPSTAQQAPEPETIPLDAYDDYAPAAVDQMPASSAPAPDSPNNSEGEGDWQSMLMQDFGEGTKFDIVDND